MTIDDIIQLDEDLSSEGASLMRRKNQDYAGGDPDPLRNFQQFGALGVLVRLSDKIARLRTYVENRTYAVKNESFRDTILDARNYLTILLALCPLPVQDPPTVDGYPRETWLDIQAAKRAVASPVRPCGCGCGK